MVVAAIEDIKNSGLSAEILEKEGVRCFLGSAQELAPILNINESYAAKILAEHLVVLFPTPNRDGSTPGSGQVKLFPPLQTPDGKIRKYLLPKGIATRPYIPTATKAVIKDPSVPIAITEGAKKALALVQNGLMAISIPGVWNFCEKDPEADDENRSLHHELKGIRWQGRVVHLAFDADFSTNPNVRMALIELSIRLHLEGVDVRFLNWDITQGKGIDDYLAASGSPASALKSLINQSKGLLEFLCPAHLQDVISAVGKSAPNKSSVELLSNHLSTPLGVKPATLRNDILHKQKNLKNQRAAKQDDEEYFVEDGQLFLKRGISKTKLGDFTAEIVCQSRGEDGSVNYTIEGKSLRGGNFKFSISAPDFADAQKLKVILEQALGPCDSISASAVKHIGPAIEHGQFISGKTRLI